MILLLIFEAVTLCELVMLGEMYKMCKNIISEYFVCPVAVPHVIIFYDYSFSSVSFSLRSQLLHDFYSCIPPEKLQKQKVASMTEIVSSQLFQRQGASFFPLTVFSTELLTNSRLHAV